MIRVTSREFSKSESEELDMLTKLNLVAPGILVNALALGMAPRVAGIGRKISSEVIPNSITQEDQVVLDLLRGSKLPTTALFSEHKQDCSSYREIKKSLDKLGTSVQNSKDSALKDEYAQLKEVYDNAVESNKDNLTYGTASNAVMALPAVPLALTGNPIWAGVMALGGVAGVARNTINNIRNNHANKKYLKASIKKLQEKVG